MSKNYAIIIHFMLPLTTFYRSGAQKTSVYKRDAFVTSWRFHNRAWQPQSHDRLPETSGTLWIHRGALTNQRCSLATGCGINQWTVNIDFSPSSIHGLPCKNNGLTQWGRDKMTAISQMIYVNAFSWMKMGEIRLQFHWNMFTRVQLATNYYWFR